MDQNVCVPGDHAGNIAAALTAMLIVGWLGAPGVFYAVAVVSVLAAASVFVIRDDELDETRASGERNGQAEGHQRRGRCPDRPANGPT